MENVGARYLEFWSRIPEIPEIMFGAGAWIWQESANSIWERWFAQDARQRDTALKCARSSTGKRTKSHAKQCSNGSIFCVLTWSVVIYIQYVSHHQSLLMMSLWSACTYMFWSCKIHWHVPRSTADYFKGLGSRGKDLTLTPYTNYSWGMIDSQWSYR